MISFLHRYLQIVIALTFVISSFSNPLLEWNSVVLNAVRGDNIAPTLAARNFAIIHTAIFDAANSVTRTHQPYRVQLEAEPGASIEGAVIGAAYETIVSLHPSSEAAAIELLMEQNSRFDGTNGYLEGLTLGTRIGKLALESRQGDGAATDFPYIPSDGPGEWRRTPPFRPPLSPGWGYVDYFALTTDVSFLPPPPPTLDSEEYAIALNEVKEYGRKNSSVRTAEQSETAVFWSDFSYTATPPGHWQEIATDIVVQQGTSFEDATRLFALLSLAQADAGIVVWDSKYLYNLWRPITAIQRANEDGNDLTGVDSSWESLLGAPPFPSYVSGHSTFSSASATVLARFYGTDSLTFSAKSDALPGQTRVYRSLAECADEVGMSRIYGGIHFGFDNVEGKRSGKGIANYVCDNYLLQGSSLPSLTLKHGSSGFLQIRLHDLPGQKIVLDISDDLASWKPFSTNVSATGGIVVNDTPKAARFYRTRRVEGDK
ncbi:MAG TPA: vanadium-dependent haloperoxidase [Verrucomicrobiae bacterium]